MNRRMYFIQYAYVDYMKLYRWFSRTWGVDLEFREDVIHSAFISLISSKLKITSIVHARNLLCLYLKREILIQVKHQLRTQRLIPDTGYEQMSFTEIEQQLQYKEELKSKVLEKSKTLGHRQKRIIEMALCGNKRPSEMARELNISQSDLCRSYKAAITNIKEGRNLRIKYKTQDNRTEIVMKMTAEGYSWKEISAATGLTESQIKNRRCAFRKAQIKIQKLIA